MKFTVDRSRSIISAMILGRKVTAMDVAWLRREVFSTGEVSREAADELFEVECAGVDKAPEWADLFVEKITRYAVWDTRPNGVVEDAEAEWLIERADACASVNALALLINVLGEARRAPRWFLDAVRARAARLARRRRSSASVGDSRIEARALFHLLACARDAGVYASLSFP